MEGRFPSSSLDFNINRNPPNQAMSSTERGQSVTPYCFMVCIVLNDSEIYFCHELRPQVPFNHGWWRAVLNKNLQNPKRYSLSSICLRYVKPLYYKVNSLQYTAGTLFQTDTESLWRSHPRLLYSTSNHPLAATFQRLLVRKMGLRVHEPRLKVDMCFHL